METFKIKAILSAVKYKSLSKAAEDFSYTPSAFSYMTSAFEEELGIKLFERHSKGVELTEEGKKLYPKLKKIVESEDELRSSIAILKGNLDYTLKIATFSSMSRNILTGFIKKLKKEYPHIKVSVNVIDNLTDWIKKNEVDIVFADAHFFDDSKYFPLLEDTYFVIAPPDFVIEKDYMTYEELYEYPYIFTDDFYLNNSLDNTRFKEITFFRSEDDLSIVNMVKDGLGLTVLPKLMFKGAVNDIKVIALKPEITRTMGYSYNEQRIEALGLTKFIKSLTSVKCL